MAIRDKATLNEVLSEIQKLIDEDYPCDNGDQHFGYQLALYKMFNKISSMKLSNS